MNYQDIWRVPVSVHIFIYRFYGTCAQEISTREDRCAMCSKKAKGISQGTTPPCPPDSTRPLSSSVARAPHLLTGTQLVTQKGEESLSLSLLRGIEFDGNHGWRL